MPTNTINSYINRLAVTTKDAVTKYLDPSCLDCFMINRCSTANQTFEIMIHNGITYEVYLKYDADYKYSLEVYGCYNNKIFVVGQNLKELFDNAFNDSLFKMILPFTRLKTVD